MRRRGGGVGVVDGHAVERVPVRVRERVRGAEVGVGAGSGRADRLAKAVVRAAGCAGVRPRVVALRVRVGVVDGHRLCARAVGDARRPRLRGAALRKRLVRNPDEAEDAKHGDGQSRDSSARLAHHGVFGVVALVSFFLPLAALARWLVRCLS